MCRLVPKGIQGHVLDWRNRFAAYGTGVNTLTLPDMLHKNSEQYDEYNLQVQYILRDAIDAYIQLGKIVTTPLPSRVLLRIAPLVMPEHSMSLLLFSLLLLGIGHDPFQRLSNFTAI